MIWGSPSQRFLGPSGFIRDFLKVLETTTARKQRKIQKRADYGFGGEYGFKHRTQCEFFWAHRVPGSELSEFLSAYFLCAKANSPSFSQNSPSLPQNSVSSLFRSSALETVFRPFLKISCASGRRRHKSHASHAPQAAILLELLTCDFTVIAFRGGRYSGAQNDYTHTHILGNSQRGGGNVSCDSGGGNVL